LGWAADGNLAVVDAVVQGRPTFNTGGEWAKTKWRKGPRQGLVREGSSTTLTGRVTCINIATGRHT